MEENTVERAIKTEKDTRTEFFLKKEWAGSVGLCQKHKPQHPHHVKVSPRGLSSSQVPPFRVNATSAGVTALTRVARSQRGGSASVIDGCASWVLLAGRSGRTQLAMVSTCVSRRHVH